MPRRCWRRRPARASPTATSPPCSLPRPHATACWHLPPSPPSSPTCRGWCGASRRWARSACSGGAMRSSARRRSAPAIRWRTRCARPSPHTRCHAPLLHELIDARASDIRADAIADDEALRDYLWKTEGALFALAARVLDARPEPRAEAAARASGDAYGLARVLLQLPAQLSRGRIPLPRARLAAAGITEEDLLRGMAATRSSACSPGCVPKLAPTSWRPGNMWRNCPRVCAAPSFLWPWSSPICAPWNGSAGTRCDKRRGLRRSPA